MERRRAKPNSWQYLAPLASTDTQPLPVRSSLFFFPFIWPVLIFSSLDRLTYLVFSRSLFIGGHTTRCSSEVLRKQMSSMFRFSVYIKLSKDFLADKDFCSSLQTFPTEKLWDVNQPLSRYQTSSFIEEKGVAPSVQCSGEDRLDLFQNRGGSVKIKCDRWVNSIHWILETWGYLNTKINSHRRSNYCDVFELSCWQC